MTQSNSILPPNATQLQKDLEAATSLRLVSLNVDALRYLNDPDNCLEKFLPWIAWAMSVDIWNNDWEAVTKRKVVRESLLVHRQKCSGDHGFIHGRRSGGAHRCLFVYLR